MQISAITSGKERAKRALASSATSAISRIASIAISFLAIPITSSYLGAERFGVWMTLSSLSALLVFADLGVGNSLINLVSQAMGRNDLAAGRRHFANALLVSMAISLLLVATVVALVVNADMASVLKVRGIEAVRETNTAILVFGCFFALTIPVNLIQKVRIGLQQGYVNGLWGLGGGFLSLMSLLLAVRMHGDLWALVLSLVGVPVLVGAIHLGYFLSEGKTLWLPRLEDISRPAMRAVLVVGGMYFALQGISALSVYSDNVIIATAVGAREVGDYSIAVRLFGLTSIVAGILLQPLWPAYSEAISAGDPEWARTAFRRTTAITVALVAIGSAALTVLIQPIANFWLGRPLMISSFLVWGLAFWAVINVLSMCISTLLNGASHLRPQILAGIAVAAATIALKYYVATQEAIDWFPWISSIAWLLMFVMPMSAVIWRGKPFAQTLEAAEA